MIFTCYSESDNSINYVGDKYDYWFMRYLSEQESNNSQFAYNEKSTASGEWQITTTPDGGLQYWNDFHQKEQYSPKDLFDKKISLKISSWIMKRNMKVFNNNEVLAVNAYNMGIGNTRKGKFYFQYCTNIIGYMAVSNFLEDYWVMGKSSNKKEWYIRRKI